MTDKKSNLTEMNNNRWVRIGNRQKTLLLNIGDLYSDDKQVVSRIEKFVLGISEHILQLEIPNEIQLLKEILQVTEEAAYKFQENSPKPTLTDCINIMNKDKLSIQDSNPMLGYYYEAMILEFVQRILKFSNAEPEHVMLLQDGHNSALLDGRRLDTKIIENFLHFKNEIVKLPE